MSPFLALRSPSGWPSVIRSLWTAGMLSACFASSAAAQQGDAIRSSRPAGRVLVPPIANASVAAYGLPRRP